MKSVGDHIRERRNALNLSQANVAKQLDISTPAFCKIETGQTDLNISRLLQIAKLFKVSVVELIDGNTTNGDAASADSESLRLQIAEKDDEINKLRKKVIELYERLGM